MTEEGIALYQEALAASEDLRLKLGKVRIKIDGSKSPKVIKAIQQIFGDKSITEKGDAYLTYDMYCSVVNLIRVLGKTTASEMVQ